MYKNGYLDEDDFLGTSQSLIASGEIQENYVVNLKEESSPCGASCCLSIFSYIKPQLGGGINGHLVVVYLSFPTSNHNSMKS